MSKLGHPHNLLSECISCWFLSSGCRIALCTDKIKVLQGVSAAITGDLFLTQGDPENDFHLNPLLWQVKQHQELQTHVELQPFAGDVGPLSPQCLIYFCPTQRNCQLMTSKPWPWDWEQHTSGKAAQKPHWVYHLTHSHLSGPKIITLPTLHVKRRISFPPVKCSLENVFFIKNQASQQ